MKTNKSFKKRIRFNKKYIRFRKPFGNHKMEKKRSIKKSYIKNKFIIKKVNFKYIL
ncbi:hypothetical protein [Candidatus Vidania fulgoroideorum]